MGFLAKWIRHQTPNLGIAGLSPARVEKYFYILGICHCLELLQAGLVAKLLHSTLLSYNDNMGLVA